MITLSVSRSDEVIRDCLRTCVPGYNGRRITVAVLGAEDTTLGGRWDEGTRDDYYFYDVVEQRAASVNGRGRIEILPEGIFLLRHWYRGTRQGVNIFVRPDAFAPEMLIKETPVSPRAEEILYAHRAYVSAFRKELMPFIGSSEEIEAAYSELVDRGLLTKGRAINNKGRNYLDGLSGERIRKLERMSNRAYEF